MGLLSAEKKEHSRVKLDIEVDAESFEQAVAAAYRKKIRTMNVPGFRRGKAPRHLVEKLYGEGVFYDEAVNDVYPKALDDAIRESGYTYVEDKIDLDVQSVGKEGLRFTAVITVRPEVTLGEYKGLKAPKKVKPVTDDDVAEELSRLQERNSRMVSVDNRSSRSGDTVKLDFEGFVDGKPFEGGKAENYTLRLGSDQFIPGFEQQLEGREIDSEFEVNVTFPEDYSVADLAGKPAVFRCRLHEIKEKELPVLDDEFAKDCSEFDTLEELKADIAKHQQEQNEQEAENAFETALIDQLIEGMQADIPEAMFKNRVQDHVRDFSYRLQSQGMDLDTYLKYVDMDREGFEEGFRDQSERQVKARLALEAVVQAENITPTDEEIDAEYQKLAQQYDMDTDKVKAMISKEDLSQDVAVEQALKCIKDAAEVETE